MTGDSVTRTRHLRGLYTAGKLRVKELRGCSVLELPERLMVPLLPLLQ
jgi:hypothetical protein